MQDYILLWFSRFFLHMDLSDFLIFPTYDGPSNEYNVR